MRAIRERERDATFAALGGPELARANVKLIGNLVEEAVVGFSEVVRHLPSVMRLYTTALEAAKHADLVIFVDYPGFNLALARAIARFKRPPKMLYYIAPQVWAWHKSRAKTMERILDRIAVVFPFEESLFSNAEFTGHPLLDLPAPQPDPELSTGRTVALLPGSRRNEVARHLPILAECATLLRKRGYRPILSMTDPSMVDRFRGVDAELYSGNIRTLLASSERAIVKSGTGTLETALLGVPLVAIYRLSWTSYWLGRMMVDVKHIAMPNILLDRRVIPELIQSEARPEKIVDALDGIDPTSMKSEFARLREILRQGSAARAAEIAVGLLDRS